VTRPRRSEAVRAVTTFLVAAAVLVTTVVASGTFQDPVDGSAGPTVSQPQLDLAADTRGFNPGNIISDNLFFDGWAMSAGDIQTFLNLKGKSCVPAAGGPPCLKTYRETTQDRAADGLCAGYQAAPDETAAWIIARVGQSCGISQRALLVIMQKEQGIVTTRTPVVDDYKKTMGFGCPDTPEGCNAAYFGFFYQVYKAAWQYKYYAANPGRYQYRAGRAGPIQFDVEKTCGSSSVYIENQATAGLYIYTPYQPNAAALAAGYGSAEPCGAYGNRNFWLYYTDWFGSTQSAGGNAVVTRATAPGAPELLGSPTSNVICGIKDGGCFQPFVKGAVYWSPATGARIVHGAIQERWNSWGWETGFLGYPTGEEHCQLKDGGCFQDFQNGAMYWHPTLGAHAITGLIREKWAATKWESGPLGYPLGSESCGLRDGGCFQDFQGGSIFWSPKSGARAVYPGEVLQRWGASEFERGPLGYPTGDTTCGLKDSGCYQAFQNGAIYSSTATKGRILTSAFLAKWGSANFEVGALGYPSTDTTCGLKDGGCYQGFQGGSIYSSTSTGPRILTGAVLAGWNERGWETGRLGYPVSDTTCGIKAGGCYQAFQGGALYSTPATGTRALVGAIRNRWAAQGSENGALGYPTADEICGLVRGGCYQVFQGGGIYWSPGTGAHDMTGAILAEWGTWTWEAGVLGYPTTDVSCGLAEGGCFQQFEGGAIYSTPGTGTHTVLGAIRATWAASGWERGALGYPTANEVCTADHSRCSQRFQRGAVYWTPATGAWLVAGAMSPAYDAAGGPAGTLGSPLRNAVCGLKDGGCFQDFQNGSLYWSPTTAGAHPVSGAIRTYWAAAGYEVGGLGYPVGDPVPAPAEVTQQFQGGTLALNRTTGTVTRR
jgi:uncharacterized protein with LGFP repeats